MATEDLPNYITRVLGETGQGDQESANRLLPLVYEQLRCIAQQRMRGERADHTLQATALVHEAYLRLIGDRQIPWAGRAHFFVAAAESMRRILLEHARRRGAIKRAGQARRAVVDVVDLATEQDSEEILALDATISHLEQQDAELAQIVRLRFYAGLSVCDTAQALGLSERTVKRRWTFARTWLHARLADR